ncbi:MAG: hypothetical protein WA828_17510, partial [Coleofasciculaceae cyanobacterium]
MLRNIVRQLSAATLSLLLLIGISVTLPRAAQAANLTSFQQSKTMLLADVMPVIEVESPVEKVEELTEMAKEEA